MVIEETKVNYHSYLDDIKDSIDPIITKMREQDKKPWRGKAWKGPVLQIAQQAKHLKLISTIKWSSLPILGPILTGVVAGWLSSIPLWIIVVGCFILSFAAYIGLVKIYEGRMAIIGDPRFHVEAFKVKRPMEYEAIYSHFVENRDFTFNGLSKFVDAVFHPRDSGHIDRVVVFAEGQIEEINKARDELKQTIESQKEVISTLEEDLELSENAVEHLVGLLKKINENLYRLINDKLALHDLDFVTGFSLYRKVDNQLHMILDKGTSGASPDPLDLQNPGRPFAAVDAANGETDDAISNTPYPGRKIVAFRMKMLNNETWVWCFHFDEDDSRALSLTESNDIIESRQIRRMIHVFCLVLQKRMLASEEVDQSAASN